MSGSTETKNVEDDAHKLVERWVSSAEKWYEKESKTWRTILMVCKIVTFIGSIASLIAAAALDPTNSDAFQIQKWLIVTATVLTAASSELLGQFKVREMEDLRETGYIEASKIAKEGRQKILQHRGDTAKIYEVMADIRNRLDVLDETQHRRDVRLQRTN